jgi:hypothetical protein
MNRKNTTQDLRRLRRYRLAVRVDTKPAHELP